MPNKENEHVIDKALAEQFERYMRRFTRFYRSLAQMTLENIPRSTKKPVIVDLGTGPGLLSSEIHKLSPNAFIMGLDPSLYMLALAMNNAIKNGCEQCSQVLAIAENIPMNSGSADIVVSRFSLSSWRKPEEGFAEIFRVLKPGGRLILEGLNKDFPRWKLLLIRIRMFFKSAGRNVTKYHVDYYKKAFSIDRVERFLTNKGFKIIKKQGGRDKWRFLVVAEKT